MHPVTAASFSQHVHQYILLIDKGFHEAKSIVYHVQDLNVSTIFLETSSLYTGKS